MKLALFESQSDWCCGARWHKKQEAGHLSYASSVVGLICNIRQPLRADPAPIAIKGSRIGLLGLMWLTGNSNTWLSKALAGLWMKDANKAQSTDLFICLFEALLEKKAHPLVKMVR